MNIKKHKFEPVSFNMGVDKALLAEAKKRGYYNGGTKWESLFSELFFNGGRVVFRQDIPAKITNEIMDYLRFFMGSFEPKHEEKAAISALLLSEIAIHPDEHEKAV